MSQGLLLFYKIPTHAFLEYRCYLQTLNSRTVIRATNGRSVEAKTVFAHSINFLKDEAIRVIRQSSGDDHFSPQDIQWVLTVPAIWTPGAKQFMREAAYEVIFDYCTLFV